MLRVAGQNTDVRPRRLQAQLLMFASCGLPLAPMLRMRMGWDAEVLDHRAFQAVWPACCS